MEQKIKAFVRQIGGRQSILAIAVLAALGPAYAQTSEMEASVSAGVGGVTGDKADRALFGQYNGLRKDGPYGLFDLYYSRRDATTGSLVEFEGLNLGLETRELNLLWKRQGDWKFSANYGELVRYDPYTVNTGLLGAGSTAPQVVHLGGGPGTGSDLDLKTKRTSLGVAFSKWFASGLQFEGSLKSEKKEGSRLFGIGMNCPSAYAPACGPTTVANAGSAVLLLPEPIDANHGQVEARLNYADGKLQLSAGYYGSFYDNSNGTLNQSVPGSLNGPLGNLLPLSSGLQSILNLPVALPPDNQAHHFDLSGNYAFTPTTRANFKLAYAQATQKQDFAGGLTGAPAGVANLDGRVDTTLAQVGISSRPLPKLTLLAEARYEDRDDKTPIAPYNQVNDAQGNPVFTFTNRNLPYTKTRGKLQATYQFTNEYQGSVGAAYEKIDRGTFTPTSAVSGISALRSETEETGFHVELRRRMTETFSGSIRLETSDRDGSNWLVPNSGLGVTEVTGPTVTFNSATAILMPTLADRRRDKAKLLASWQPTEALSLQFSAEGGEDKYKGSDQGLHSTRMNLFSVDFNYAFSDAWSFNGYASTGTQRLNQSRPAGYILAFDNTSTNFGLGVIGKPNEKIDLGAGLSFVDDKSVYAQTLDATANAGSVALLAATGGLPDIVFRSAELKLFGKYALSKESALRLDAIYQRAKWNDWAYGYNGVPFRFSDNTTVTLRPEQDVTYVGFTYIYAWR